MSGDRMKTGRRDAKKIAELFRTDLLTEVHPPNEEDEASEICAAHESRRRSAGLS